MGNTQLVFDKIKNEMPGLSEKQKDIAGFILREPANFLKSSLREIEKNLGVSKSAIVRLSLKLGYESYSELKSALWKDAEKEKAPFERYLTFLNTGEKLENQMARISTEIIDNIKSTTGNISVEDYERAVAIINSAERVYVLGHGISHFLAQITSYLLNRVGVAASSCSSNILSFREQITNFNKGDLVIVFSYPIYSPEIMNSIEFASERGLKILLFTDSFSNTGCRHSDLVLLADVDSMTMANTIMAPLTVIYAMAFQIGSIKKDDASRRT